MKKIIFLLSLAICLIGPPTVLAAQTFDHTLINIEKEVFDAADASVFVKKTVMIPEIVPTTSRRLVRGKWTVTHGNVIRWNTKNSVRYNSRQADCGIYGLNLIHSYCNFFNFEYQGKNDTSLVLTNSRQEAYISVQGSNIRMTVISHPESYVSIRNNPLKPSEKTFVYFSRQEVDSLSKRFLGYDINELERRSAMVFHGSYRDKSTHLVHFFPWATVENGKIINRTFINGQPANLVNTSNLTTALGRKGFSFMYRWQFLNGCAVPTEESQLIQGNGNLGQCGASPWLERRDAKADEINFTFGNQYSYDLASNTVTFDSTKPSHVVLVLGEKPISGKESSYKAYINPATGSVSSDWYLLNQ